ncbi:MAG: DNA alkylation repair protein [Bryobacterales bacterium]|nr:DNA alkylation repair protein [Bryobacterales bacterium]
MTVDEMLAFTRAEFIRLGTPKASESAQRFFKEPVDCYGVTSPQLKDLEKRIAPEIRTWKPADRNRFCVALLSAGKLEEANLVPYLYKRYAKTCAECEFKLFARWMERYVSNWSTCDGISVWLIGAAVSNQRDLAPQLISWTSSKSRWVRRSAAVSMIPLAKKGEEQTTVFAIAPRLLPDPDEMVQKGIGWLLKENYVASPQPTVRLLRDWSGRTSRLVLRYAAEKMNDQDRRSVLGRA